MLELYVRTLNWIESALRRDEGQDLVEYAVLLALIALIVWVAVRAGGQQISTIWHNIATALTGLPSTIPS